MKNIIIGTAGHIDHGKTTLIKALTGRSTDTLKEEIKRGISINLGFTYFDLPSGKRAGIIDVPGHEKFIKNMIAGASGIDVVLLAIAANEGIKPQTVEHIDILSFLDIKDSIIVLTKCELADEIMKELVIEDIYEQLAGTFLENAEIIEVDSISGKGLDNLVKKIDELSEKIQTRNEQTDARLNVDRIFSSKGFGTVITGTLVEGTIKTDDELIAYPSGLKAKVRNIQVHEQNTPAAYAGQRTALNLSGIKVDELKRGDVLAAPGAMKGTSVCDVKISLVEHTDKELKLWDRLRIYLGSSEKFCRIVPLGTETIKNGQSAFCQFRFEEEVFVKKNDRFVARYYSPMETIGGGIILDPEPKKHGRRDKAALDALEIKEKGDIKEITEEYIRNSGKGITLKDILAYVSGDAEEIQKTLDKLCSQKIIYSLNKFYFHIDYIESVKIKTLEYLSGYHNKYPLRKGAPKEEVKSKLGNKHKEFDSFINMMVDEALVRYVGSNYIALSDFKVIYNPEQKKIKEDVEKTLWAGGFTPPSLEELVKNSQQRLAVLESLYDSSVVKLDLQTVIHRDFYDKAKSIVMNQLNKNGEVTLAEFRDITNSSRKYCMLLLESFDNDKITIRVGDKRVPFRK